jgi:transposase
MEETPAAAYVGIDWAAEAHQVCVTESSGQVVGEREVAHSGDGLDALDQWLRELGGEEPQAVFVAIEVPHGAVVETLMERGFVVHAINPKQMDRFRDRFSVAGAKDDRLDALVLASALRTDPARFRRLDVLDPVVIELREWSRMLIGLKDDRNALANRLREQLRRYYPQMLKLTQNLHAGWFLELWRALPTPAKASRARPATVARILKKHGVRKIDAQTVIDTLRERPLTVARGTAEAAQAHIRMLAEQLDMNRGHIKQGERRLDELTAALTAGTDQEGEPSGEGREPCDVAILQSLPGVGRIVLATLLAEASQPLGDRDYPGLRCLAGIAPVTRSSGKRRVVVMRRACNERLRNALYHWARVATQVDPTTRQRYTALRKRGHSHGRALRQVGDRLLSVACAMLRSRTLFEPERARAAAA